MLERTSRFVLEALPYLLTALIAAVVLPQLLYSEVHGTKTAVMSKISYRRNVLEPVGTKRAEVNTVSWGSTGRDDRR